MDVKKMLDKDQPILRSSSLLMSAYGSAVRSSPIRANDGDMQKITMQTATFDEESKLVEQVEDENVEDSDNHDEEDKNTLDLPDSPSQYYQT